jgi:RNA recognition motif-containing protein
MSDREDYKIYVGNLKYDVTERQVRQYFEHYGKVDEGESLRGVASWCLKL